MFLPLTLCFPIQDSEFLKDSVSSEYCTLILSINHPALVGCGGREYILYAFIITVLRSCFYLTPPGSRVFSAIRQRVICSVSFAALGAVPSPFDCYLCNRGLKTLPIRMKQHFHNALAVAQYLESNPRVQKVLFPGELISQNLGVAKKKMF